MLVLNDKTCWQHIDYMVERMKLISDLAAVHKSAAPNATIDAMADLSWLDPLRLWHPETQEWIDRIIGSPVNLAEIQHEGTGAKRAAAIVDLCLKIPANMATVENPEEYLHPTAQAEMASFLVAVTFVDKKESALRG